MLRIFIASLLLLTHGPLTKRGDAPRDYGARWVAQVTIRRRIHHLGCFDSEEEAAAAASAFRLAHLPFTNEARASRSVTE